MHKLATSKRKTREKRREKKRNKEGRKRGETEKEENKNRTHGCVLIGDGGLEGVHYLRGLTPEEEARGAMKEATLKEPWERRPPLKEGRGGHP